jgi:hypothetical protein
VFPAELGRTSPAEYAQMWADEKVLYNAGQRSGLGIGHYTAMIWKATSEVGCGFVAGAVPDELGRGGGTDFLVCRYKPAGQRSGAGTFNRRVILFSISGYYYGGMIQTKENCSIQALSILDHQQKFRYSPGQIPFHCVHT